MPTVKLFVSGSDPGEYPTIRPEAEATSGGSVAKTGVALERGY
jgi:hypothetical protein